MKTIDIRELNDHWFTKCLIKYELGFAYITENGSLAFESRVTNRKIEVKPEELLTGDNKKFNKSKLRKGVKIIAKHLINKESRYIIVSHEGITLDEEEVDLGDVVLMTEEPRRYDNYKLFVSEIKTVEKPNLKEAVALQKQGVKGTGVKTVKMGPTPIAKQVNRQVEEIEEDTTPTSGWKFDKHADYSSAQYIITKSLFEATPSGGAKPWGYLLKDNTSSEELQLPFAEVFKLAAQKQIKNAKMDGKKLSGIGCNLEDIEQDFKS